MLAGAASHRRSGIAVKVAIVFVIGMLCIITYRHRQHEEVERNEREIREAQQRQKIESLSAQLQVVYEHKTRLEKALEKEKDSNKQDKSDLEKQLTVLKENCKRQKIEFENQITETQKQLKKLQTDREEFQNKIEKNEQQISKLNAELQSLESNNDAKAKLENKMVQLEKENSILKIENTELKQKLDHINITNIVSTKSVNLADSHLGLENFAKFGQKNSNLIDSSIDKRAHENINNQVDAKDSNQQMQKNNQEHGEQVAMPDAQQPPPFPQIPYKNTGDINSDAVQQVPPLNRLQDGDSEIGQVIKPQAQAQPGLVPNRKEDEIAPVEQVMKPQAQAQPGIVPNRKDDEFNAAQQVVRPNLNFEKQGIKRPDRDAKVEEIKHDDTIAKLNANKMHVPKPLRPPDNIVDSAAEQNINDEKSDDDRLHPKQFNDDAFENNANAIHDKDESVNALKMNKQRLKDRHRNSNLKR